MYHMEQELRFLYIREIFHGNIRMIMNLSMSHEKNIFIKPVDLFFVETASAIKRVRTNYVLVILWCGTF